MYYSFADIAEVYLVSFVLTLLLLVALATPMYGLANMRKIRRRLRGVLRHVPVMGLLVMGALLASALSFVPGAETTAQAEMAPQQAVMSEIIQ